MTDARMLAIDIETMPGLVYTYDLFQPVISHKAIVEPSRIICYSAQWYGEKKVQFSSEYHDGPKEMLESLWNVMNEADIVLGYNTQRFDVPWIRGELMMNGLTAPSPVKHIDLFQTIKSNTRLMSKKLDYVSHRLLDDKKIDVNTMTLAIECQSPDPEVQRKAWNKMRTYSKKDTALLFPIFDQIKSFVKMPHPLAEGDDRCRHCGSYNLHSRGTAKTLNGSYQRFVCTDCGSWNRGTRLTASTNMREVI